MGTRETPQLPGIWILVRDIGTFVGGWAMAFLEVARPEIRESVLVFAASAVGIPGLALGWRTVADAVRSRTGTDGPSGSPPPDPSPP